MRAEVVRCTQTGDYCPGITDFRMIWEKEGAFGGIDEEIEVAGFINCGGYPGKKAVFRVRELVKRGADTIVLAFCIQKRTPTRYPCPFTKRMKEAIQIDLPNVVKYLDSTH